MSISHVLFELQTQHLQGLPRISNTEEVQNLSEDEVVVYCRGYGINMDVIPRQYWRILLAKFIGYREQHSKVR